MARRDAFNGVNRIWFVFVLLTAVWCMTSTVLVWMKAEKFLISLLAGPFGLLTVYFSIEGFSDPAWFTLLALSSIAMFVSIVVTVGWVVMRCVNSEYQQDTNQ